LQTVHDAPSSGYFLEFGLQNNHILIVTEFELENLPRSHDRQIFYNHVAEALMNQPQETAINPTRAADYPEWYQQVIKASDLAESSVVRGCMVIKPWGYAIWENIQRSLDEMFKNTGHVNAYFPLLIPLSFLEKEAEHVEGFAKECAVVTHHRLEKNAAGGLTPAGKLDEPFVIRPTSETIIGASYAKWVQSYRDLPLLINQWANVMRWEMRTRMFLRTSEFLWQEGHTVHATAEEAVEETLKMLDVYEDFAENWMAMPVIKGVKTPDERFPGAVDTYTIEAMMQDRKALQSGTSHFLGQNFARSSGIKFLDKNSVEQIAWTTSWGVSTRLIGGLIMTHSDDNGLVLPPKLAPQHVVIMPIYKKDEERTIVLEYCQKLAVELRAQQYAGSAIRVFIDDRDTRGGEKAWQHIKKGVPIRLEVGPRDVGKDSVFMGRRDFQPKEKRGLPRSEFVGSVSGILNEIQNSLLAKAKEHRKAHTVNIDNLDDFRAFFTPKNAEKPENHGGFALAHWNPAAINHPLLAELKVTPRCIPLSGEKIPGKCLFTGESSGQRIIFAKSY
jgi:prolyl-tRNA synthetase